MDSASLPALLLCPLCPDTPHPSPLPQGKRETGAPLSCPPGISVIPAGPLCHVCRAPLSFPPVVSGNPVSFSSVPSFVWACMGKTMDSRLKTSGMTAGRNRVSRMGKSHGFCKPSGTPALAPMPRQPLTPALSWREREIGEDSSGKAKRRGYSHGSCPASVSWVSLMTVPPASTTSSGSSNTTSSKSVAPSGVSPLDGAINRLRTTCRSSGSSGS